MKKVLIITYYWPPSGGSGVQRWMYFAKYLSEFGYEPYVLTVSEQKASYKNIDRSFLERVKDIKTFRTNTLEPLKVYSMLTTGSSTKGIPQGHVASHKKGIFNKISSYIRANFFVPDARVGWNSFAVKKAKQIIRSENIDLVITTGPPHSSHLIGLKLKEDLSIKWVADFRDPWMEIYYYTDVARGNRAKEKDRKLEAKVLEKADRILTIGFKLKDLLLQKVDKNQEKFHHIYNGYDSQLMDEVPVERQDYFEITFIGIITQNQPYQSLVESLNLFLKKVPHANFKICLAGNIQKEILEVLESEFTTSRIVHKGYVPHREAIGLMKRAQLLINILAETTHSQIIISGKQMEYIATGNPVLCITRTDGESAFILKDIENSRVLEKEQVEESAEFIVDLYEKWEKGISITNDVDDENITRKSRYETTRQLAQFLNEI